MSSPKSPKPSKFRLPSNRFKEEEKTSWFKKILAWLFIIAGTSAIIAMIVLTPKEKKLVCKNPVIGKASLTTFGTCTRE